ncbi:ATP-binding protein [Vibrio tritonius]|uniref:ATP-binding protein n=1 Tax=Vibrio tritonius TaxID=1435069 RepID=UPI00315DE5EA
MRNSVPVAAYSIKKRLTWSVVILSTLLIMISLIFSFIESRHEIEEVYDARLGQSAKMTLLSLPHVIDKLEESDASRQLSLWMSQLETQANKQDNEGPTEYGHPYEQNIVIQYYRQGELLWSSIPDVAKIVHEPNFKGYGYVTVNRQEWRYFQLPLANSPDYVIAAEKQSIRQEMMNELALTSTLPQLILIPCLAILMVFLIDRHFEPISELRRAISLRSVNKLDKIYVPQATLELSPLVDALNVLLFELDNAWHRERRFTRMAAHELKTPLAILRLNAEAALETRDDATLHSSLKHILAGIERTDRLIQQLLMLARVESVQSMMFDPVDVYRLLQNTVADIVPMALVHKQELALTGENAEILGDAALLRVLFTNLLDNAIRYSGEGSEIDIEIESSAEEIKIKVSDTGPDINDETRAKLFDNFYRANSERGDGAGLGMSITRDIARLHHGTVELLPRKNHKNTFLVKFKHH